MMDRRTKSNIFQSNRKIVHLSSDWKIRWALTKHSAVDFKTSSGMKSSFYCISAQTELDNRRSVNHQYTASIFLSYRQCFTKWAVRVCYSRLLPTLGWSLVLSSLGSFSSKGKTKRQSNVKTVLATFFCFFLWYSGRLAGDSHDPRCCSRDSVTQDGRKRELS